MELTKIKHIINNNKTKGFVKRIIDRASYTPLDNGDGTYSTHSMAWSEIDGKYIVYPTVLMTKEGLKRFDPVDAIKETLSTGNYITFDNAKDAADFSREYKKVWGEDFTK